MTPPDMRVRGILSASFIWLVVPLWPCMPAGNGTACGAPMPTEGDRQAPVPLKSEIDLLPPTLAKLQEQFADIKREIARLQRAGDDRKARDYERQLQSFKDRLEGAYPAPTSKEAEVHVVGLHKGAKIGNAKTGAATVEVTYTGKPIILALCAYDPVQWTVELAKGAQVKYVIVSGYHDQSVTGLPKDVPISYRVHDQGDRHYFFAHKRDSDDFARAIRVLRDLTASDPTTFQGTPEFKGRSLVVGPENTDWRIEHILWDMRGLHEAATRHEREMQWLAMQKLKFPAPCTW